MKERANDAVAERASRKTRGGPGAGKRMAGLRTVSDIVAQIALSRKRSFVWPIQRDRLVPKVTLLFIRLRPLRLLPSHPLMSMKSAKDPAHSW